MPSTNGHGPKRAILYSRVSTDEQARSGYSIPDQLKELRGHAVREGYQVVEEIEDEGYSGGDPYRPGLQRVMQLDVCCQVHAHSSLIRPWARPRRRLT
jgi:Resolvase, N terminal domain